MGLTGVAGDRRYGGCAAAVVMVMVVVVVLAASRCLRLGLNMNEGPRFSRDGGWGERAAKTRDQWSLAG